MSSTIPNVGHVLKDANSLRQTALQKKQIEGAVKESLIHISDLIYQAHENGHGYLETTLPMQFGIEGMSFSKMQQNVWCRIINELKQKNYKVSIEPMDTECVLYVQWESEEDRQETKRQLKMLAMHTIKSNDT